MPGDVSIHVGTHGSARARLSQLNAGNKHFIKLRIKTGVKIAPTVKSDDMKCHYATNKSGVVRYVNAYENPGSISLVGKRRDFEIIETRCAKDGKMKRCNCLTEQGRD